MAGENARALYPNSNLAGNPIPLDMLLVLALMLQDFTVAAANDIAIPTGTDLLVVYGDADTPCFIQLDDDAAVPASGTPVEYLHYIPAGSIKVIDADGADVFGVISADGVSGTVIIEFARAYKDTRKLEQHTRG